MGGIRLEQTTRVYPNGVEAIDDVALEIRDGEFMVLCATVEAGSAIGAA
jgi:ABC-type phosphate/phosphonate transport system ATPase subunit